MGGGWVLETDTVRARPTLRHLGPSSREKPRIGRSLGRSEACGSCLWLKPRTLRRLWRWMLSGLSLDCENCLAISPARSLCNEAPLGRGFGLVVSRLMSTWMVATAFFWRSPGLSSARFQGVGKVGSAFLFGTELKHMSLVDDALLFRPVSSQQRAQTTPWVARCKRSPRAASWDPAMLVEDAVIYPQTAPRCAAHKQSPRKAGWDPSPSIARYITLTARSPRTHRLSPIAPRTASTTSSKVGRHLTSGSQSLRQPLTPREPLLPRATVKDGKQTERQPQPLAPQPPSTRPLDGAQMARPARRGSVDPGWGSHGRRSTAEASSAPEEREDVFDIIDDAAHALALSEADEIPLPVREAAAAFERRHHTRSRMADAALLAVRGDLTSQTKTNALETLTDEVRRNRFFLTESYDPFVSVQPRKSREEIEREKAVAAIVAGRAAGRKDKFSAGSSTFAERVRLGNTRDLFETLEGFEAMFATDWEMARKGHGLERATSGVQTCRI